MFLAINQQNLADTYPLMSLLRTDLTPEGYQSSFGFMQEEGYRMIALTEEGAIKALAGFVIQTNFYNKKHLFLYDLVTDASARSKGYGKKMMEHLEEVALENGCHYVALESGLFRTEAHRFYEEKNGYEKFCYSFRKPLSTRS